MATENSKSSKSNKEQTSNSDRRSFLKKGAAATAAASVIAGAPSLSLARSANAGGSNTVKIGLIGSGGRGTGASVQAMQNASGVNVELHAVADVFESRAQQAVEQCVENNGEKVKVGADQIHVGLDAWKRVLDSDVDFVFLATPPGFRPLHFENAIDAGKHVFMEKPVAVDAPGVRRVLAAGEKAREKKLWVQVGLQRRHERCYRETITQLKDGIIGDLVCSRVYWNNNGVWNRPRGPEDTELMYQLRNWYYFNWICGDHIVEQHIHNLDVINWLMDDFPVKAQGMGGRLVRTGKKNGEIFDHHSVEYTYANGHKMFSFCRHMPKCWTSINEYVHGSKGSAKLSKGAQILDTKGNVIFEPATKDVNKGHQIEHDDLFQDYTAGNYVNEAEYGAKSTFTAILGRLATYSGKELDWDKTLAEAPSLANVDEIRKMDDPAPVQPLDDGSYAIPVPGQQAKKYIGG